MSDLSPFVLVLAAGRSRRMGQPKALVPWEGCEALRWQRRLYAPFPARLLVVRPGAEWLTPARAEGFVVRENPLPEGGQLSSLQVGLALLAELAPAGRPVLVTPVDCLGVQPATLQRLVAPGLEAGCPARIPVCQDRPGHPVLLSASFQVLVRQADPARTSLRQLLAQLTPRPTLVAVDDPAILHNLNTPAELAQAHRAAREGEQG